MILLKNLLQGVNATELGLNNEAWLQDTGYPEGPLRVFIKNSLRTWKTTPETKSKLVPHISISWGVSTDDAVLHGPEPPQIIIQWGDTRSKPPLHG